MTDTPATTAAEVELRRRLDAVAGVAAVDGDGWDDLQARLAARRPRRRQARRAPLAVAAAAAAVAAVALIPHDTEDRARTVDGTTTTTHGGSTTSAPTTTAPDTTSTTAAGDAGLPLGPGGAPGGPGTSGAGATGGGIGPGSGGDSGAAGPATGAPATPTTTPPPTYVPGEGADLEVTLSASGSVTFTARVDNHGADVAVAARATVTLSDTMIVNSVTSSAGACTAQGGMVYTCDLGDLAAGAAVTITVDAQVWASPGSAVTATVAASSAVPDPVGPGSSARMSVTA